MKMHIRDTDRRRREEGLDLDLNPYLADLGLQELISEPPPLRSVDDEFEEDQFSDEMDGPFEQLAELGRGLAPSAVRAPLSEPQIADRLKVMRVNCPSPDDAAYAVAQVFPHLLDFFFEATQNTLLDKEQPVLELLVVRACHLLAPMERPGPALEYERILRGFAAEFARVSKLIVSPKQNSAALARWAEDSPQPVVMRDLVAVLFTGIDKLRRKDRPRDEALPLILACAKALVAELSRAGLE
jgi:hypothetical protein